MFSVKLIRLVRALLSTIYLILVILTIPLAFDVGGVGCGLAFSLTIFIVYFLCTTIKLVTRRSRYFRWVSLLYYAQHFFIPSLLTLFLSYHNTTGSSKAEALPVKIWGFILTNSTSVFTILEGFCSLLLIQATGQTINWLTVHKSDSWVIVSLVLSGSIITAALSFLYRIFIFPFTIDMISATLLGSLLTLTVCIGLFGILSGKGSIIESSLLFAYIVRCIYETFPVLSENATNALASLFKQATISLQYEIPNLPQQIINPILHLVPFLTSNIPRSFKAVWEFLIMAIHKLTLPLLLNLAYRIGVFYAATKIIPSLYYNSSHPTVSPPRTPSRSTSGAALLQSTEPKSLLMDGGEDHSADNASSVVPGHFLDTMKYTTPNINPKPLRKKSTFRLKPPHRHPSSTILKLIYAYSPCLIIAVYTHLMMLYNGQLGTELKIWGFWHKENTGNFEIVVHPWQFWNWINMSTTLLLYAMELFGNGSSGSNSALTSHWKVE